MCNGSLRWLRWPERSLSAYVGSTMTLRFDPRRRHRRTWLVTTLAALAAAGCVNTVSLPLGGIATGRGHTLGSAAVQVSSSFGSFPEVGSTLAALTDSTGLDVGPALDATTARSGRWDPVGLGYGVTDWLDVGLSFSRGLYGFVRLLGDDVWAFTLSPSIYRHSVEEGGSEGVPLRSGRITNASLTGLGVYRTPILEDHLVEVYGGGTASHYRAWLATSDRRVERQDVVPGVIVGLRSLRRTRSRLGSGSRRKASIGLGMEGGWTWMRRRDGVRSRMPMFRVSFTLEGVSY